MSDTPRTDAEIRKQYAATGPSVCDRPDDKLPRAYRLARTLERESNSLYERNLLLSADLATKSEGFRRLREVLTNLLRPIENRWKVSDMGDRINEARAALQETQP